MNKKETMQITIYKQEAYRIKEKIAEEIEIIISIFEMMIEDINKKTLANLLSIHKKRDSVELLNKKVESDISYELSKSLFAKDLSRITNLLVINVKIDELAIAAVKTYVFYERIIKKHKIKISDLDNRIIINISKLIISELKDLISVIESENKNNVRKLLEKDDEIDKAYRKLILDLSKDKIVIKKIPNKEEIKFGYVLAVKSLERAGDIINISAKQILKIEDTEEEK